jgi:hypothetical protein
LWYSETNTLNLEAVPDKGDFVLWGLANTLNLEAVPDKGRGTACGGRVLL